MGKPRLMHGTTSRELNFTEFAPRRPLMRGTNHTYT